MRTLLFVVVLVAAIVLVAQSADPSGSYTFLRDGELLQVYVEPGGKIAGIVSRYDDDGKDVFIDHYINGGSLDGDKLEFTTQVIHGTSFRFTGTVVRGRAKSPSNEGYFLLRGKLTRTDEAQNKTTSTREREVEFKSLPLDTPEQ